MNALVFSDDERSTAACSRRPACACVGTSCASVHIFDFCNFISMNVPLLFLSPSLFLFAVLPKLSRATTVVPIFPFVLPQTNLLRHLPADTVRSRRKDRATSLQKVSVLLVSCLRVMDVGAGCTRLFRFGLLPFFSSQFPLK